MGIIKFIREAEQLKGKKLSKKDYYAQEKLADITYIKIDRLCEQTPQQCLIVPSDKLDWVI